VNHATVNKKLACKYSSEHRQGSRSSSGSPSSIALPQFPAYFGNRNRTLRINCPAPSSNRYSPDIVIAVGGTNFELDGSVVACGNSRMALLADPSFQDGNGSQ